MAEPVRAERLLAAHVLATQHYNSQLTTSPRALAYLRSRGISIAAARSQPWTVGYARPGWTHLRDHLHSDGFTDTELLAAGLVSTSRTGVIDVFRDRVMFPIRDQDAQVVGFTGRDLSGRCNVPKYRNSPATAIYGKSRTLYGLAEQLAGGPPGALMLVEGPADVLAITRLPRDGRDGYRAVAPCGTALTAEQVDLLAGAVAAGTPLVVVFDADEAGRRAGDRAFELLQRWTGPVQAIKLPNGTDPADLIAEHGPDAVGILGRARTSLAEHVIDHRLAGFRLDEVEGRLNALRSVAPMLAELAARDPAEVGRLGQHLAVRLRLNGVDIAEAIFPPDLEHGIDLTVPLTRRSSPAPRTTGVPLDKAQASASDFPDPDLVGHDYAHLSPVGGSAATWVHRDPATGHTAWVIAEGVSDSPGDLAAARLAAEVAGRTAVLVGAQHAVELARTALNVHFANRTTGPQGNAVLVVLTSFDHDRPGPRRGQFTVAWAGDLRAYGSYGSDGRWFAPLTLDHTVAARAAANGPHQPGLLDGLLTSTVRGGPIGVNRIELPVSKIILTSRLFSTLPADRLAEAGEAQRAVDVIDRLRQLTGLPGTTIVVRPTHLGQNRPSPAELACSDRNAATPATNGSPDVSCLRSHGRSVRVPAAAPSRRRRS